MGKKFWILQSIPLARSKQMFAPTFACVLQLAVQIRQYEPQRSFCLFLDNLFLNLPVAKALLALDISCMGTTRKNATGIPPELIEWKERRHSLVWNSVIARIVDSVLCFVWQDNNAVLGITTAYNMTDTVLRLRNRPKITSTNAAIVRPVFGDAVQK